jgi:hypothetical protein
LQLPEKSDNLRGIYFLQPVNAMSNWTRSRIAAACVIAAVMIGAPIIFALWMISPSPTAAHLESPLQIGPVPLPVAAQRMNRLSVMPIPEQSKAITISDPALTGLPYAAGWPLALPGQIIGTPVAADLEGDGKLEVIVPCIYRNSAMKMAHPHPDPTPMLFAFHSDGAPLDGWPVALGGRRRVGTGPSWGGWASSPSVFRRDGKDVLVLEVPGRGVCVIGADRRIRSLPGGDQTINVPLADLNNNGEMDVTIGRVATTVDGGAIPTWPASRRFHNGYAPCIGSVNGDGTLQLFHLFYTNAGTPYADVVGFDVSANRLPGWPQKIDDPSWLAPVMGDVTGDGKMDVIASYGTHVFAWKADGEGLPNTTTQGPMSGIFKSGLFAATACPALADLDGSGKADIIVYDWQSHAIRAWHGNGVGIGDEHKGPPTTQELARQLVAGIIGRPIVDGVIASLPGDLHGVSVVSLGDDPQIMDFFVGAYWVRRFPDGRTTTTRMVPSHAEMEWTQPTIADVEGTGKADVIFGLSDGRLFVYRTNLAYHAERMQWPTANGNFQHTGAWKAPATKLSKVAAAGLQFRLVAETGDPRETDDLVLPGENRTVRVLKKAELDERDLARAYLIQQDGHNMIVIDFSVGGSKKLATLTEGNIHHALAVVLDGKLLSAPTIETAISKSVVIAVGGDHVTVQQAQDKIDAINNWITAKPGF